MNEKKVLILVFGIVVLVAVIGLILLYQSEKTGEFSVQLPVNIRAGKAIERAPAKETPEVVVPEEIPEPTAGPAEREPFKSACPYNGCSWGTKMFLKKKDKFYTFGSYELGFKGTLSYKEDGILFDFLRIPQFQCFKEGTELYVNKFKGMPISGLVCENGRWEFIPGPLKSACPDNGCGWYDTGMIFHISATASEHMGFSPSKIGGYELFDKKDLVFVTKPIFYDNPSACVKGGTMADRTAGDKLCIESYKGILLPLDKAAGFICIEGRWWLGGGICGGIGNELPVSDAPPSVPEY